MKLFSGIRLVSPTLTYGIYISFNKIIREKNCFMKSIIYTIKPPRAMLKIFPIYFYVHEGTWY